MDLSPIETEAVSSPDGVALVRHWFPAASGRPPRAGAVLLHGLGDHCARYQEVLAPLRRLGLLVAGTDLPGHGRSGGRRGEVPSLGAAVDRAADTLAALRARLGPGVPTGVLAHSAGAFLACHLLARRPPGVRFAWLNGTLVDPANGQGAIRVGVARAVAAVWPTCAFSTRVRRDQCVAPDANPPGGWPDPLHHARVSAKFGVELIDAARSIASEVVPACDPSVDLLMTHGGDDTVCPPGLAAELFEAFPMRRKRFVLLPGLRHETFLDQGREALSETLEAWLRRVLDPSAAATMTGEGEGA